MSDEAERMRAKIAELRKRKERLVSSLSATEERFQKVFHASSNPITIVAVDDGRIIDLNQAAADMGGFRREDLRGRLPGDNLFVDPNVGGEIGRQLQENGNVRDLATGVRTKDGEIHTMLLSMDPITVNDEACLMSITVDITAREQADEALRKSEEKYRMLVENSLQGVAIVQDEHYVFCNAAFARMTGYTVDELLAMSAKESEVIIHPDDLEVLQKRYRDRLAGKPVSSRNEYRGIRKDGTQFYFEVHASLIEYNGKPATQLLYLDITERKQAEQSLRESEERFRLIAETIDEIFYIIDPVKEVVLYISPAHERIWGYSLDRLYSGQDSLLNLIHPEDQERVRSSMAGMKEGRTIQYECRILRSDGSIRYLQNRAFPVRDKKNALKFYIGVGQDITAWKLAEDSIREAGDYLHQIINCIGDPVFVKNRAHRFTLVNNALCAYFDLAAEELIGKTGLESMPEALGRSIWEDEERVFKTGKESITEDTVPSRKGIEHVLMTKKSLLTDKDGNRQLIGVMRDITDYKKLEAQFLQAQKMDAIGILAGGVAHDFNNLLNVINGYSELILDDLDEKSPVRRDLEEIREAGRRAAMLTSQLLAFGRKQILQPEIVNLNELVAQMSTMLRRLIGEDIELSFIAHPRLRPTKVDPGQFHQVLMNLAINARDAMPQGGKLTIETSNADLDEAYVQRHSMIREGPYVMLAVSDNGIGMDEETKLRLFEPFYTTKQKGKGTGLGLSTVYGIVKQSNGHIYVYSEIGKGTTFKIYFPQAEGDVPSSEKKNENALSPDGSETVLVVEDEEAVRELTARILRERGYTVLEAADGRQALQLADDFPDDIHLVITDVIMPGVSGSALVAQLKSCRPQIKSLFVSGYADDAIVRHGMLNPDLAFLQKPFTVENLMRKIREVLHS
jgi:PAS domain S-box-containing protein